MIGNVLARYSECPTIYGTVDPCKLFRSYSFKFLRFSSIEIVVHLKLKFHQERNI